MSTPKQLKLRLYVAGDGHNSRRAIDNLHNLCENQLTGQCDIETVDVLVNPQRALADGIRMTPTLVKLSPAPVRQIVGTLSETETVLEALGPPAIPP